MKTLLVTGANGLLGQNIIKQASKKEGVKVIATGRGDCRFNPIEGVDYYTLDLTDKHAVDSTFGRHKPDWVIHTAAMTNVDQCEKDQEACKKNNIDATEYVTDACKSIDAYLVNLSTDFVFDGENGPYKETDQPNPVSYYGLSKLKGEQYLEKSGVRGSSVRTIIVFGVVDNMSRSNLVLWTKKSLENKEHIRVINDQHRAPTWAGDLAWACLRLCELEKEGIYHVSGPETKTIIDWVREVVEYFELDDQYISEVTSAELNQPAKRPPITGFIIDKAINDLGYQPKTFKEGIAEMMNLLKNQN